MSLATPPRMRKSAARNAKTAAKVKMPAKMVYFFGPKGTEGDGDNKALLGGKGANLAKMCNYGLPVPPGFTITTEVCDLYYKAGRRLPQPLLKEVKAQVAKLEKAVGKKFGCKRDQIGRAHV